MYEVANELVVSHRVRLRCHQSPETLTGFQLAYILRGVGFPVTASEKRGSLFVLAHIGFSRVVSQNCGAIVSSGRRGSPNLFPCAFHSPHLGTCLHQVFCGTCVSDRMHEVKQIQCSQWVPCTVKVGWHHSIPYQGSFQISIQNLRYLLPHRKNRRHLSAFGRVFESGFQLRTQIW